MTVLEKEKITDVTPILNEVHFINMMSIADNKARSTINVMIDDIENNEIRLNENIEKTKLLNNDVEILKNLGNVQDLNYDLNNFSLKCNGSKNGNIRKFKINGLSKVNENSIGFTSCGHSIDVIKLISSNCGNMLDLNNIIEGSYINKNNGSNQIEANSFQINYFIPVTNSMKIVNNSTALFSYYDKDKQFISGEELANNLTTNIPLNACYMKVSFYNRLNVKNTLYVGLKDQSFKNVDYKYTIKEILYNTGGVIKPVENLKGISETIFDSIETSQEGKYYFHKRTKELIINGTESWGKWAGLTNEVNTLGFYITLPDLKPNITAGTTDNQNLICDSFPWLSMGQANIDSEAIYTSKNNTLYLRINKDKLETPDVEGLKKYLQVNNFTIIYKLLNDEIYECVDLTINSFEGETYVNVGSGLISPKINFNITTHISSLVKSINDRLYLIENNVTELFKLVLKGDVQSLAYNLYPNDFKKENGGV